MTDTERIKELEEELKLIKTDNRFKSYYVLNRSLGLKNKLIEEFDLINEAKKSPKDNKYFERAMAVEESIPTLIKALTEMKRTMRLTGDDEDKETNAELSFLDQN